MRENGTSAKRSEHQEKNKKERERERKRLKDRAALRTVTALCVYI